MAETKAICPYCQTALQSFPAHKKKCPICGQFIFVRTSSTTREKILVREDEAAEIERQRQENFEKERLKVLEEEQLKKQKTNQLVSDAIQKNKKVVQDLQASGLEMEKSWSTCGDDKDCKICKANEKVGWIPLNQPFPSGHQNPLAHDGCRCDLLTRLKKEKAKSPVKKPTIAQQPKKKSGCGAPAAIILLVLFVSICFVLSACIPSTISPY